MTIRINDTVISEDQILRAMQYHPAPTQREAMIRAAESLVIGELMRQRAEILGINTEARDDDGELCYVEELLDTEVAIPEASETEARHYFEQNRAKFVTSPLVAASHILLMAPADDEKARVQAVRQAEALIERLKADPSAFGTLASQFSECPSKAQGGQLGQLSKGQTVAEFERQVFTCTPGLIPYPVETRYGVHVVRVDHHEDGRQLPYEMVEHRVKDYLNEKVRRKAIAQYIHVLASEAHIEGFSLDSAASPLMQ